MTHDIILNNGIDELGIQYTDQGKPWKSTNVDAEIGIGRYVYTGWGRTKLEARADVISQIKREFESLQNWLTKNNC